MLLSMLSFSGIKMKYKEGQQGLVITFAVIGFKLIIYFLYLFVMIVYFPINDMRHFVFIFMLTYILGTATLIHQVYKLSAKK